MSTFKLERRTNKRNRGMKLVAEREYVGISNYSTTIDSSLEACIDLRGADERYTLVIPADKLQSVIDRLEECKTRIAQQQTARYQRLERLAKLTEQEM